jgi:CBS domain containing-hemolysin-like protein
MDNIPLLFVLLLLSGFFSGAEIALFSLGIEKIHAVRNQTKSVKKRRRLHRLENFKSNPHKALVTILIGNNVVNIAASAMATVMATDFATQSGFAGNSSLIVGVVTGVMTFLILLFGEVTPKAIAHRHALRFALIATPILQVLQFVLYPLVAPLAKLVGSFSGGEADKHGLNEDELKAAINLSEQEGKIESDEKEMVEKVLEFKEHNVEAIMTPRSKIFSLKSNLIVSEATKVISEEGYSRIPVFDIEDPEKVVGIMSVHLMIDAMAEMKIWNKSITDLDLRPPYKIPPTMKIDTLLREFQARKVHLALVYDENGGLIGLITLEDVLEEIFGEFLDEQDDDEAHIYRAGINKIRCNADTELEKIEDFIREKFGKKCPEHFPWDREDENHTVGYFMIEQLEHFPKKGEKTTITLEGTRFTFTARNVKDEKVEVIELTIE